MVTQESALTTEYPMMFHYLLELHKDGKSLARLELNVPTTVFQPVQANSLLSLEALLVNYGQHQPQCPVNLDPQLGNGAAS